MCGVLILLLLFMTGRDNSLYSRFCGFNSRLGAPKFPIGLLREFTGNKLVWLMIFGTKLVPQRQNRKNPGSTGIFGKCSRRNGGGFPKSGGLYVAQVAGDIVAGKDLAHFRFLLGA